MPNWLDATAYEPLLEADRSLFAWEWLRRNPAYQASAERAFEGSNRNRRCNFGQAPERWGLHDFVPPRLTVPFARPVWCAEVHPFVLAVEAVPGDGDDVFDVGRFGAMSTLVRTGVGHEHLLISDGLRAIRLDVVAGTLAEGPAELRYRFAGLASAEGPAQTLGRLLSLWRTDRFCRSLHPVEPRAKRWSMMLRAQDALTAGANQREIAAVLLSPEAGGLRWRFRCASVRTRAQRLVRGARRMASGGYFELLR